MNNLKRVQLDMPEKAMLRLQEIKAKTEAASYAEVIKNALRLYHLLLSENEVGNKVVVQTRNGEIKEYVVL